MLQELWSTELELPKIDYEAVIRRDKVMLDFLVTLERKGVVVLTDAPREPGTVFSIINSIGYVKPTHYGYVTGVGWWIKQEGVQWCGR